MLTVFTDTLKTDRQTHLKPA